jgi:hypothetical protein
MKKLKDEQNKRFTSYVNLIVNLKKLINAKNDKPYYKFDYEILLEGLIKNYIFSENLTPLGHKKAKEWLKKITKEIV